MKVGHRQSELHLKLLWKQSKTDLEELYDTSRKKGALYQVIGAEIGNEVGRDVYCCELLKNDFELEWEICKFDELDVVNDND